VFRIAISALILVITATSDSPWDRNFSGSLVKTEQEISEYSGMWAPSFTRAEDWGVGGGEKISSQT
jgi:hypothetical protein